MIMGRLVYEVARLVSETASDKIAECMEERDDLPIHVRGSLMLALVANEVQRGTSKEDLVKFMETIYDIVSDSKVKN